MWCSNTFLDRPPWWCGRKSQSRTLVWPPSCETVCPPLGMGRVCVASPLLLQTPYLSLFLSLCRSSFLRVNSFPTHFRWTRGSLLSCLEGRILRLTALCFSLCGSVDPALAAAAVVVFALIVLLPRLLSRPLPQSLVTGGSCPAYDTSGAATAFSPHLNASCGLSPIYTSL